MKNLVLTTLLATCLTCASLPHVAAAEQNTQSIAIPQSPLIVISPDPQVQRTTGYYVDKVKPGDTKKYSFYVTNVSDTPIETDIYPSDSIPNPIGGGKNLRYPTETNTIVGAWMNGPKLHQVIQPKETIPVTYTVNVPQDLKPGQYIAVAGIAQNLDAAPTVVGESEDKTAKYQALRYMKNGVQIQLNYNNDQATHSLDFDEMVVQDIQDSADGLMKVYLVANNKGTILERPKGTAKITNVGTQEIVYEKPFALDSIYTETSAMVQLEMDRHLNAGKYQVHVDYSYNDYNQMHSKDFFFNIDVKQSVASAEKINESGKVERPKLGFDEWIMDNIVLCICIIFGILLLLIPYLIIFIRWKKKKKKSDQRGNSDEEKNS